MRYKKHGASHRAFFVLKSFILFSICGIIEGAK